MMEFALVVFSKHWQDSINASLPKYTDFIDLERKLTSQMIEPEDDEENIDDVPKTSKLPKIKQGSEAIHHTDQNQRLKEFYALPIHTRIDLYMFLLFIFSYTIFNCIYWI